MDSNQVIHIFDKYFNTTEIFGDFSNKELNVLLYLMFIDEYYEIRRNELLIDKTNKYALNDCVVKKLNETISSLKNISATLFGETLDELPSVNHWIIPEYPKHNDYIENNVFHVEELISNIIHSSGEIINNVLKL